MLYNAWWITLWPMVIRFCISNPMAISVDTAIFRGSYFSNFILFKNTNYKICFYSASSSHFENDIFLRLGI